MQLMPRPAPRVAPATIATLPAKEFIFRLLPSHTIFKFSRDKPLAHSRCRELCSRSTPNQSGGRCLGKAECLSRSRPDEYSNGFHQPDFPQTNFSPTRLRPSARYLCPLPISSFGQTLRHFPR